MGSIFTLNYLFLSELGAPLCWFCQPEKIYFKSQSIEYIYTNDFEKMKTEDFPDPSVSLIGFVIKYEVKTNKKLFISLE